MKKKILMMGFSTFSQLSSYMITGFLLKEADTSKLIKFFKVTIPAS